MPKSFSPSGIIVALVTPLSNDQSVDEKGLRQLVNYVLSCGVHGVFVNSNVGEFYALTTKEKEQIISIAIEEVNNRVPVYVGTGAITTSATIAQGNIAANLGGDALVVITPYLVKNNQVELVEHYQKIASESALPIILYNNPNVTNMNLETDTVVKLLEFENIVGIKDSSGNLIQTMDYIAQCPDGFAVMAGNDALICATLLMGGKGAMASTGNVIPGLLVELYNAICEGELERAIEIQYKILPLRKAFNFGTFPVLIKEAVEMTGLSAGPAKSPIRPLGQQQREKLSTILKDLGVYQQRLAHTVE